MERIFFQSNSARFANLAAIYLMLENYRKKLICIKYNINYKKNQEVKPKQTDMRQVLLYNIIKSARERRYCTTNPPYNQAR